MAQGKTAKTRDGAMSREEIVGRLIQMRNHIVWICPEYAVRYEEEKAK